MALKPDGFVTVKEAAEAVGHSQSWVRGRWKKYLALRESNQTDIEIPMDQYGEGEGQVSFDLESFRDFCDWLEPPQEEPTATNAPALWHVFQDSQPDPISIFGVEPKEDDLKAFGPGVYRVEKRIGIVTHGVKRFELAGEKAPEPNKLDGIMELLARRALDPAPAPAPQAPYPAPSPSMNNDMMGMMLQFMQIINQANSSAEERILGLLEITAGLNRRESGGVTERVVDSVLDSLGDILPPLLARFAPQIQSAIGDASPDALRGIVGQLGAKLAGEELPADAVDQIVDMIAAATAPQQ